jgi:MFS family permease
MFGVGRAVAGLGSGILAIVVPMYQGEVATAETRGFMMCVTGVMYAFGYTFAGWLGMCAITCACMSKLTPSLGYGFAHIPGVSCFQQDIDGDKN